MAASLTANGIEAPGSLLELLAGAEAALASGDTAAAAAIMEEGARLCRRLQDAGSHIPAHELDAFQTATERCHHHLGRLAKELQADSAKGENFRRGMTSYQNRG